MKEIKETAGKDVGTEENVFVTFLKTSKMNLLERFRKIRKLILNVIFRKNNLHKTIEGQININPIRNKLDPVVAAIVGNTDMLLITETKIDSVFTENQFYINDRKVRYRHHPDTNGGGILVYDWMILDQVYLNKKICPVHLKVWL